jgi:hypothetical protein
MNGALYVPVRGQFSMSIRQIDITNIGLMIVSFVLALIFPVQLFLFSFAVLGPLHYLTEIPWLKRKGFFTTNKFDYLYLVGFCAAIGGIHYYTTAAEPTNMRSLIQLMGIVAFVGFMGALGMTTLKKTWQKYLFMALAGLGSLLFYTSDRFASIFANLLPTIVHVFIFTGAFVLYGALRHRSVTGILSLVVYVLCTIFIFTLQPLAVHNQLSKYVVDNYYFFADLNFDLMNIFGYKGLGPDTTDVDQVLFYSSAGIIVMRFIAFTYTYHFLNWFSKTSIIKWHETKKPVLAVVFGLWIVSLVLYVVDFRLALNVLYGLSLLHVFLEYPLNHRSFIGIGEEIKKLVSGAKVETA